MMNREENVKKNLYKDWHHFVTWLFYIMFVMIIIALLISFYRPVFLTVSLKIILDSNGFDLSWMVSIER